MPPDRARHAGDPSRKIDGEPLPRVVERALKRALLRSPGVTQRDAAAALGCSEGHLAHCLNGSDTRRLHASDLPDVLAALPVDEAVALVETVFLGPLGHRAVPQETPAPALDVELDSLDLAASLGSYLGYLRECLADGMLDQAERRKLRAQVDGITRLSEALNAALAPTRAHER
jgi:hypothetical protein